MIQQGVVEYLIKHVDAALKNANICKLVLSLLEHNKESNSIIKIQLPFLN